MPATFFYFIYLKENDFV